jgi:hypothetical protein
VPHNQTPLAAATSGATAHGSQVESPHQTRVTMSFSDTLWGRTVDLDDVVDWEAGVKVVNGSPEEIGDEDVAFYIDLLVDFYTSASVKMRGILVAAERYDAGDFYFALPDDKYHEVKFVEEVREELSRQPWLPSASVAVQL